MEKKSYVVEKNDITLADLLYVFRKRKVVFFSVTLLAILVTVFYLKFLATPLYEASVKIKVPTTGSNLGTIGTSAVLLGVTGGSPDVVTHVEILKSRRVIEEAVKEALKRVDKYEGDSEISKVGEFENLVKRLRNEKYLSVTNSKNSPIIEVKLYGTNKDFSLLLLEELMQTYMRVYTEISKDEKIAQLEELEKLLPKIEQELKELGDKIKEFRLSKSFLPSEEANVYFSKLMSLTTDKNNLLSELELLKVNQETIKSEISKLKGNIRERVYTPQNPTLEGYSNKLAELQIQYNTMLLKYTEQHPDVIALKEQMRELQRLIDEEIKRTANSQIESPNPVLQQLYSQLMEIELKIPILTRRIKLVENAISEIESKIRKLPDYEQQYVALQRDYSLKQGIYVNLAQKYEELKINTAGVMVNKPQVLDPPYVSPFPTKPNKKLSLAVGAIAGIFLGTFAAFLVEMLDKKIRTFEDLKNSVTVPIVVFAAKNKEKAVKTILAHVLNNYPSDKTIAVVSPDAEKALDETFNHICNTLEQFKIAYEAISLDGNTPLILGIEKVNTPEILQKYVVLKAPPLKSQLEGYLVAKKSDGIVITVSLNVSTKQNLLQTLSWCSDNDVKVYGVIAFRD